MMNNILILPIHPDKSRSTESKDPSLLETSKIIALMLQSIRQAPNIDSYMPEIQHL